MTNNSHKKQHSANKKKLKKIQERILQNFHSEDNNSFAFNSMKTCLCLTKSENE